MGNVSLGLTGEAKWQNMLDFVTLIWRICLKNLLWTTTAVNSWYFYDV